MKIKIGNVEKELELMNNLFITKSYSELVIRGQILIKTFPKIMPFYNFLGLSYKAVGKGRVAAKVFEAAIFQNSNEISVLTNLADVYLELNKLKESEKLFNKAFKIDEKNLYALNGYAKLKRAQGKMKEAIKYFKLVHEIDHTFDDVLLRIANAYLSINDFEEAKKYFEVAVYKTPLKVGADYSYSQMIDYSKNKQHQEHMLRKLKEKNLDTEIKGPLYFAIAKSYSDQKNYQKAYEYFKLGNDDMNTRVKHTILQREIHDLKKIKSLFSNFDFNYNFKNINLYQKNMVFIVGLPRTGTTLTHQIISSHPNIKGIGESKVLHSYFLPNIKEKNFKDKIFKDKKLNEKYLSELSFKLAKDYEYFSKDKIIVDKAPYNIFWIGFIKILFPNAKIIHMNRDIKDAALSIYNNLFGTVKMDWAYSQDNIISYIKIYKEVMNFWKEKIPNYIYDLHYEDLVNNQEEMSKKIIKFCDLEWNEKCLKFYESTTPVHTVSLHQSRKPMYKTSVNLNSKYSKYQDFFKKIENL